MEEALKRIAEEPGYRPYPDSNVKEFITTIVYGGIKDRDVLGDYKDYLLSITKEGI